MCCVLSADPNQSAIDLNQNVDPLSLIRWQGQWKYPFRDP